MSTANVGFINNTTAQIVNSSLLRNHDSQMQSWCGCMLTGASKMGSFVQVSALAGTVAIESLRAAPHVGNEFGHQLTAPLYQKLLLRQGSLALQRGWVRRACVTGLAFLGVERPGEPLRAARSELILPSGLLDPGLSGCLLQIRKRCVAQH